MEDIIYKFRSHLPFKLSCGILAELPWHRVLYDRYNYWLCVPEMQAEIRIFVRALLLLLTKVTLLGSCFLLDVLILYH